MIQREQTPPSTCVCTVDDALVQEWVSKAREVAKGKGFVVGNPDPPVAREQGSTSVEQARAFALFEAGFHAGVKRAAWEWKTQPIPREAPSLREAFTEYIAVRSEGASQPAQGPALTFADFSAVNRERCESANGFNHALESWSTSDWFTAVMGELGEAANIAKKLNRVRDGIPGNKETSDALREKLRCELGDVFVYLDLLAQSLGFSIGDAARDVFNAKSDAIGCVIKIAPPVARVEAERS